MWSDVEVIYIFSKKDTLSHTSLFYNHNPFYLPDFFRASVEHRLALKIQEEEKKKDRWMEENMASLEVLFFINI